MARKKMLTETGIIIKKKLIELNLTQRELADYLGIKDTYLNMIMYGDRSGRKYINAIEEFLQSGTAFLTKKGAKY